MSPVDGVTESGETDVGSLVEIWAIEGRAFAAAAREMISLARILIGLEK